MKIQGYVGSKFGYGVNATDNYVVEPTKTRVNYQLDPGVVFTKPNESVANDFISYPGIIDSIAMQDSITDNNSRLFKSQFYSWDSFTNLDKLINFNEYYWLPVGPPAVTISAATVYSTENYAVTSLPNGYEIALVGQPIGSINPTLGLIRGGTYTFAVNQSSQFWIQTDPGTSGYSPFQSNLTTRQVYGVDNNGASQGVVTFTVPQKNAQDQYIFPGNNTVDLVSTKLFDQVNGAVLKTFTDTDGVTYQGLNDIDGVTALEGLRIMFYYDGIPAEKGNTETFLSETPLDINSDVLVAPIVINVTSCDASAFTTDSTSQLVVGQTVTFNNPTFGGVTAGEVYYVHSIPTSGTFTIALTLDASSPLTLVPGSGTMVANINQGLYEESVASTVFEYYYLIEYIGDPKNPTIRLVPDGTIPVNQTITPLYGTQWNNIPFYRSPTGVINPIPVITAPLDVLYYQDGTSADSVGVIKIIDSNTTNTINVVTEILGNPNYTSSSGVVFTNGLKVNFQGDIIPTSYLQGQYYVQGVGTAIELVPVSSLVCTEDFTHGNYIPYDSTPYDISNYDSDLFIPTDKDYITIARNAINKNAWSRSNRWFHIDVINATAKYNNDPNIATTYATQANKAVRPIIEFYPNLKLYNSGSVGAAGIDFIDTHNTDALSTVAGSYNYYPDTEVLTTASASVVGVTAATSTTFSVDAANVSGTFQIGMYVADSSSILPNNTQITDITGTTTLTVTVSWPGAKNISSASNLSIVGSDTTLDNYALFPEARIVFAADSSSTVRNKIYVVNFSVIDPNTRPVITLTVAEDGNIVPDEQLAIKRGYYHQGTSYYYDGIKWIQAQQKVTVNQPPLFDVFDANGISFGDSSVYQSTSFKGCKLFAYSVGSGVNDPILGFPIAYSGIDNVGDISFDVSLNLDTFNYVSGYNPINQKVNTGYVYNYTSGTSYVRQLGWQTAIADSTQYQLFSFDFDPTNPTLSFQCDVAALPALATGETGWPRVKVYINNVYQAPTSYATVVGTNTTTITFNSSSSLPTTSTVVQVLVLSDQVSQIGYYDIPINLNNNPLNADLTTANVGDIRAQYRDIFINSPNTTGEIFGANNFRDCGNLVPYGTEIIQNSASLVLPGTFFRNTQHNLFDALMFNSREYIKYKQLLVYTVQNTDYVQRYTPSQILDSALDQITAAKSEINAFFWSDMLPSKAPYRTNTYTFNNQLDTSVYPLSNVYNFETANYSGVLVYVLRTVAGVVVERQLTSGIDYIISPDAPSLTIISPLGDGDKVIIKEYNQTYGSYIPNTPTKLGLYPSFYPEVVLDSDYTVPTYFIKGHDGSFTKLYGDYDETLGVLIDFRDQALLEFELRIYNNLKLSTTVPIERYEVVPGYFRSSTSTYSWNEFIQMYEPTFLNWIGQNRLDYKSQYYQKNNEFSYNYTNSGNKLDQAAIQQGYWRGVYEYFYDTTTPNETPWEMLGFANEPTWWADRYGPTPYTSDNGILWGDLEAGYIWNNGNPYTVPELARPGLSKIIPVDSNGDLLSPLIAIVGNYNPSTFQKDWVVGDDAPVELSYRRSSTWPFDLMRLFALTRPAEFFNLAVDLDNYKYNAEFNQYLVNDRSHLVPANIEIYGNGTAKTSYINWIVDYEKQQGVDATTNITTLLNNLDVRLVYRLAGYSDKTLLQFYVEKGSPNSNNATLLIPNESYSVLLYDNQPFDQIMFSGVVIQKNQGYWTVYGNSQTFAYFKTLKPINNGTYGSVDVLGTTVKYAKNYTDQVVLVPYGTKFYSTQGVVQFLMSYGAELESQGMLFNEVEQGIEVTWAQMAAEFLYWSMSGWEVGSLITLNPSATAINIDRPSAIVQPLTVQQTNFILNQNLYPIQLNDLCVERDDTLFHAHTLNQGDSMSYAQFNVSNFEHGIVFDNVTLFNDIIYNLTTGLRQNRIYARGVKTADWNGTVNAWGFILNQDNVLEWNGNLKYTKGVIVQYKNKYWTALKVIEPSATFNEQDWKLVNYNDIQKGMLSNASTRAYESTLYYDVYQANLEQDADLLAFSLIGYRPRDYLALVDLTDSTQVQVYQNLIKNKGTRNAVDAFQGATFPQGSISYDFYENWSILTKQYGGVLNENFVDFRINQTNLMGNPSIVSLTNGVYTVGSDQEVPLYNLFNYNTPPASPNVLSTLDTTVNSQLYPSAGYINVNDVKMSSYFFSGLPSAVDSTGAVVPINNFYVGEYFWLANFKNKWDVFRWTNIGQVIQVRNNTNGTATITFSSPHSLNKLDPMAIINFAQNVDGYYIVADVLNLYEVVINLSALNANQNSIQGRGLAFGFVSQRVASPAGIIPLASAENEFIKNTVWVDENTDGNWAVYRKSLNYAYQNQFEQADGGTFGSAVAYTSDMGYLIGDSGTGILYRYIYDSLAQAYLLKENKTGGTSFGSTIKYAQNLYAVSQPSGVSPAVTLYTLNHTVVTDRMLTYQTIAAPGGVTDWGSALAISGDTNWLYISDAQNNNVYVYRKQNIPLIAGYFVTGETYVITSLGSTDFTAIGAVDNKVGITFVATGAGAGTGTATQITYKQSTIISGSSLFSLGAGDGFGTALATSYDGSTLAVTAPFIDYSPTITNWGTTFVLQRTMQNFEAKQNSLPEQTTSFSLSWTPAAGATITASATSSVTNRITCSGSMTGFQINQPVVFAGSNFGSSNVSPNQVYYIHGISGSEISIKTSRSSTTPVNLTTAAGLSFSVYVQVDPLYVYLNGKLVTDDNYAVIGTSFIYYSSLIAGDILTVSDNQYFPAQQINSDYIDRTDIEFGYAVDMYKTGSTLLIGSPYEVDANDVEGAVYSYVNGGAEYGVVIGTNECNVTTNRTLLINGFAVNLSAGNAQSVANTINSSKIINVQAAATSDNKLIIQVINQNIAQINQKLTVYAYDSGTTLSELGINLYTKTQIIQSPHEQGASRFGSAIKINEFDSVIISAPVGTRYEGTFFDFTDDENLDNDTVFDNNATQFVDSYVNAGAVYMFDYIGLYNESLANPGAYVYAQSVNSKNIPYGQQPLYGTAIDFNENVVVVGSPNFYPVAVGGQVVVYNNATGVSDWSVYRNSAPIVDISKIQNTQIFSASTNQTLINLDYMDPLQGKLLGAARENLDFVSGTDPARYNSDLSTIIGSVWGAEHVGQLWFNTNNVRWMNYHQNDNVYNSKYWGAVFPGSDVAVYTWVASFVPPNSYPGPGAVYNPNLYVVSTVLNASNNAVPVYYFWVSNTNIIFEQTGKTLSDSVVASYISNPKGSGIAYMAPLLPNTFALYNSVDYFNANDSVFHIGFANGTTDDVAHQEYALIRENYQDDFLPGLPHGGTSAHTLAIQGGYTISETDVPYSLYAKLLDSLAGCDGAGAVVPNPWLPLAVQSGIRSRPNQSFFYDRYLAINNYLTYANTVLAQYPIAEIRPDATFLFQSGTYFNTADYWSYVNWWATGYSDSTKSSLQVPNYADLAALNVAVNTIVTVEQNGAGKFEVYRYDGYGVWTRIGLQNGTIAFDTSLWDYSSAKIGYGDNFFDTTPYDQYPSEETRYIVRALTEQIYISDLLIYRNTSLILLFDYIQSETTQSQNFLPWLNKTSLADVSHTIRELIPYEVYQTDNTAFLSGYINEVKPYHVVIKDFVFKYTGTDVYQGNITDFDLPATYNSSYQQYISPQLVYSNPNSQYEYLPTDSIWSTAPYTQWFQNHGVSITGQPNYNITVTTSYVSTSSTYIVVDNAHGFPINGTINIGNEIIGYSFVDRALNVLSGLVRGVNGTPIENHITGAQIYIDLPAALVLFGGRGYVEPPKVTAYIDTSIYPAPKTPAVLEAVMNLDSVLQINVIDPGEGYAVLPEIVIDPAEVIAFDNTAVNGTFHTIRLYAPNLQTGDAVLYKSGITASVGALANNQWYYINVLETVPTAIIALYTTYSDAINDKARVKIYPIGIGSDMTLSSGARASAITTALPIRENNTTIRFDRTTYGSQVQDWEAGAYYGSFFAGTLDNSSTTSSSSIGLESTEPPIDSILASAQGAVFEITDISNDQQLTWSSFIRYVSGTTASNHSITLIPQDNGGGQPNASGTTIGFYIGMPVKFQSTLSFGGLVSNQIYYVNTILSETEFTVSTTVGGPIFGVTDSVVGVYTMECFVGEVTNTAVMSINYPGILQVTATTATTNALTVPTSLVGTGGTLGFYTNLPVFFTEDVFGGIVANKTYYVTSVIDNQTFTMSATTNPVSTTAYSVDGSTDRVAVNDGTNFNINDIVVFTDMVIAGTSTTNFGGLVAGTFYYVSGVYLSSKEITLSATKNGAVLNLTTVVAASDTSAIMTNQKDTVALTTAVGSATMNVSLPISPGQINGQLFTIYETSGQYPNNIVSAGEVSSLISRSINATISAVNRIAVSASLGGTDFFYKNMPIRVTTNIGNLVAGTTYYIREYTGDGTNTVIEVTVTNTSSSGNVLSCGSTASLYIGMPIVFSGQSLGGIFVTETYYIQDIPSSTTFTLSLTVSGPAITLTNDNGVMTGAGDPFFTVSTTVNGSEFALSSDHTTVSTATQYVTGYTTFDLSYKLGGYSAVPTNAGSGFAVNNIITIPGTAVGGTSPANDITLEVNSVDALGGIINVIASGNVPSTSTKYYLKVISSNQLEVYSNPLLTVPVSGINFPFNGYTTTTVQSVSSNIITVNSTTGFNVNDAVVFTGNVSAGIVAGQTYYIVNNVNFTSNTLQISSTPGGTAITLSNASSLSYTMAKSGSYAFLPEPFYFNQSIVKFNNKVYICVISNNDKEFVIGKWEELDSGDRRLNAMDRVMGYYKPTVNMPGVDLTQLFDGVTYPNSIYLGNAFQPNQQFALDVVVQDQPFYPSQVNITAVEYHNNVYHAVANLPTYSALLTSADGITWAITQLANTDINVTNIVYNNGTYLISAANNATPILTSVDGLVWTVANTTEHSSQAAAYGNGCWISVGDNIVRSTDAITWNTVHTFDSIFEVELYGVSFVQTASFTGFVAVGNGLRYDYSTGVTQLVPTDIIITSADGITWTQVAPLTNKSLNSVVSNGTTIVALGENNVQYTSTDAINWFGNEALVTTFSSTNYIISTAPNAFTVNAAVQFSNSFSSINAGTTYYVKSIVSPTLVTISDTLGGSTKTLSADTVPINTLMYEYDANPSTVRDSVYVGGTFVSVGDNGLIKTSTDGYVWTLRSSGTTQNLNGITYDTDGITTFTVVGDNNTVLTSTDTIIWTDNSVFTVPPTVYDVKGADFPYGYGPEELVPGVVTDNLALTVVTRPGSNWDVTEYSHTGFNVVSLELAPTFGTQTVYTFAGAVQVPAQLTVQIIDPVTGLGTGITEGIDYTINWLNKTVILSTPLQFSPKKILRIDVYEVGNGDQLVQSSTDVNPIRVDDVTGFNEVYVDCNYSASVYQGSGVIRPGTSAIESQVLSTDSTTNRLTCTDISKFILNGPVTFLGVLFGGVVSETTYYVKSISTATDSIIISASIDPVTGLAGPAFDLVTASGDAMYVSIQSGNGQVWTTPIMYHNGNKLVLGATNIVIRTQSINNSLTTNSTFGFVPGTRITFSNTMFAGISPQTTYYVSSVINNNEFTISATNGGPVLPLPDTTGGAIFVTNDYAFGTQPNGIAAKIIFASDAYTTETDYIVYSLFGETTPQYGYAVPEIQYFTGTGSQTAFTLSNYVGENNPNNAVVEVNGVRKTVTTDYSINPNTNVITFTSAPVSNSSISVLTYNDTQQQYLTSQYGLTGTTVAPILSINTTLSPILATTTVTATSSTGNLITATSTAGFVVGQQIQFFGIAPLGGIKVDGTMYWVGSIISNTFTIKDQYGVAVPLSNASGTLLAEVGGISTTRVTTTIPHGFAENSLVRIDGTVGSIQLNNNIYYARVITDTVFDLYQSDVSGYTGYNPTLGATNYPVIGVSTYISGGYTWLTGSFNITTTTATATTSSNNTITVASTANLIVNTPVYFSENYTLNGTDLSFGGLVSGTEYYVSEIVNGTTFVVSDTYDGPSKTLTTSGPATINVTQWSQQYTDRIWVTVNGLRVPSSKLRINPANEVSILAEIQSTDKVIITSMIAHWTPEEMTYMNFVDKNGVASVYRSNTLTRTWLTESIQDLTTVIYVNDVNSVIQDVVFTATVPTVSVDGYYYIGLPADKRILTAVSVVNISTTPNQTISSNDYEVVLVDTAPTLKITPGSYISTGNTLTINVLEGDIIYVNGEAIRFNAVDIASNSLLGIQRGVNGTAKQSYIPAYTEVFGLLTSNKLDDVYYNQTWNSYTFNTIDGDPLQISTTTPALFLQTDIT